VGVGPLPQFRHFMATHVIRHGVRWALRANSISSAFSVALLRERERWPLWLPVWLGAGIGIYFALPFEPQLAWAGVALSISLACLFALNGATEALFRIALSSLAVGALGFALAKARTEHVAAPVLERRVGPIGIDGRVEQAELHGKGIRIVLGELRIGRLASENTPARVRISVRTGMTLPPPGSRVHVTAVLMPPPSPAAPGAYDFGRAAYYMRLGAVGYAYGHPTMLISPNTTQFVDAVSIFVEGMRAKITARIHSVLPGSTGGIAAALITGNRSAISEEDEKALRDAGLAHVLAIAGLHMALVGLGLYWVVRAFLATVPKLALSFSIKKWAAAAAICSSAYYLVISGATAASTRAFIMLAMMLCAILFDRPAISMRSLALAATTILVLGPESLIEPGFQMSFAAVMSLIAVAEWESNRTRREPVQRSSRFKWVRGYLRGITITSLVGSVATIPYAIYHFNRATHYAVLGNLLAMPIMGFVVMPAAALTMFLMPFGLDGWTLRVMAWGINVMLGMGRWVSSLPGAVSVMPAWPTSALVLVSIGGLWVGLWRRAWRWFGVVPILCGLVVANLVPQPDLLIGRDATTFAMRVPNGALKLLRPAKDLYSADEWLKRDGDIHTADNAVASPADGVNCDALGCIAKTSAGLIVADVLRPESLAEDCASASIVVTVAPVRGACSGPKLVIAARDVLRANGYAIWLAPRIRYQTVEQARGRRPWSVQREFGKPQYLRISPTSFPWMRTRSAP
jgi:competence protein ComEC